MEGASMSWLTQTARAASRHAEKFTIGSMNEVTICRG
jgi:hypothetical protein